MKKVILTLAVLVSALSCTKYSNRYQEPYVPEQGRCTFTVQMDDPAFTWDAVKSKIGVYSETGANVAYSLRSMYDGRSGEVEFFGPATKGIVTAYYPYVKEGYDACREGGVSVPAQQKWCESFESALKSNMPFMVSVNNDGKLYFRQTCGALHMRVKIDFPELVNSVTLSGNSLAEPVTVVGIDKTASVAQPLDVWVILEEGSYDGFILSVAGASSAVTAIIEGDYTITASAQTDVEAREKYHDYGGSEFEGEEVEFD